MTFGECRIKKGMDVAIYLLRRHTNKNLTEIGQHFEITNYSTIGTVVEKIKSQIKTGRKLNKQKSTADLTPHFVQKEGSGLHS